MKRDPQLVVLLVVASMLIAGSAMVVRSIRTQPEHFAGVKEKALERAEIGTLDVAVLDDARTQVVTPVRWDTDLADRPMFVTNTYAYEDGKIVLKKFPYVYRDPLTGKEIPGAWFKFHGLPTRDPAVTVGDPDNDGFTNADEWRGNADPNDQASHPPYHSLLFLTNFQPLPFLLKFSAYDGDPKRTPKEEMTFQVNARNLKEPTRFLKIGDTLANGKYRIVDFKFKTMVDANGVEKDVSELTLENVASKLPLTLVLNRETQSPDSEAQFAYLWTKPATTVRVAKYGKFTLPPMQGEEYQLLEVSANGASLRTPSGEEVKVGLLPPGGLRMLQQETAAKKR